MKIKNETIRAYALKNALNYKGKAQQGFVISSLFNEGLNKEELKDYIEKISKIVEEINSLDSESQKKEFEKLKEFISEREVREGLQELPNSEKGVVMRFAPSASGPLHIGHALVASLNWDYVMKYGGKMIFRIEDTNPENVYADSYDLLKKDSEWLMDNKAELIIQSERLEKYYEYAKKLIEKESAYVCTCDSKSFKENYADKQKECPCRSSSKEDNLEKWNKMFDENSIKEGGAVLRFKSSMQDKNPAMRDFPLARINETKHPLQGNKFRVWPLMNLAVTVDDIDMKVSHIIRGKDHRDNAKRQEKIYAALGEKNYPWVSFLGKVHIKGMELSTSKMREGINEGKFSGWDDENLPTLISLRNKGYKKEAFWKLSEHVGLSENDKTISKEDYFELLKNFNK